MPPLCSTVVGAMVILCTHSALAQDPTEVTASLTGTWNLQSLIDTLPDGSTYYWLGTRPTGEIRYDATGRMAVQFMKDPRPTVVAGQARHATPLELRALYDGYYAYFGRYELNARRDSVVHYVEASLRPEEVGVTYRRAVQIEDDYLVISLEYIDAADSLRHRRFLTFRRVR